MCSLYSKKSSNKLDLKSEKPELNRYLLVTLSAVLPLNYISLRWWRYQLQNQIYTRSIQ
nr:MAG TPA: hypothetical protein [Caudoviricetes sp.]